MFAGGSMAAVAPGGQGGLWDVLRKEARGWAPEHASRRVLAADAPSRAQARKLEGEVDSKLAAFSKLGARARPARGARAGT